jgi:Phospholipase_D-nuclease N-terminal
MLCGDQPDMGWLGGVMTILFAIALVALMGFAFWIWMFVHAIKSPIENKAIWVVCFIIFGIVTAVIYYFVVKRNFTAPSSVIPPIVPPSQTTTMA